MRAAALAILLSTGCSVFFDPGKIECSAAVCRTLANATASCVEGKCAYACVRPFSDSNGDLDAGLGSNGCEECVASSCAAIPNATAVCAANQCLYSCTPAFLDRNSDLNQAASNGCETPCPTTSPVPAELHALVGNPSGGIHWLWDPSDGGELGYQLCTGSQPAMLTSCSGLDASTVCSQPTGCSTMTMGTNNLRQYARLQTIDACGKVSSAGPVQSATPIDGQLTSLSDLSRYGCDAGCTVDGGVLNLTQGGLCLGAVLFGDDEWQDFTLRAELRLTESGREYSGGIAFHFPTTLPETRSSFRLSSATSSEITASFTKLLAGQAVDRSAATSIGPVESNRWIEVELISVNGEMAAALAPVGQPLKPTLRWREPVAGRGRFGLYLATGFFSPTETVEFRNVTLATRAVLPDAGSGSIKLDLKTSTLPSAIRVVPPNGNVVMSTCPSFPAAPGCPNDGGCLPEPGSRCIEITQLGANRSSATFDQPLGLDPKKPWRLSFKFATTPLGNNGQILRTLSGNGSILRGPPGGWNGPLTSFGAATDAGFAPTQWNRVDYTFTETAYALTINGTAYNVAPLFPPSPDWDAHLGAFILGGPEGLFSVGNVHAYWTDIEIAQPP